MLLKIIESLYAEDAKKNMQDLLAQMWFWQRRSRALSWGKVAIAAMMFLMCSSSVVLAADEQPKPNPLEMTTPDPLLPQSPLKQPLSPQERLQLKADLDELNAQAGAQFKAGNALAAYEIWHRELRLRRVLGPLEEIEALGRVGGIAWQDNQKAEVQLITKRLQAIQQEVQAKPPIDLELLRALGQAYLQVRFPGPALSAFQEILADARQRQDTAAQETTLKTIAELQMAWFDYPKAAAAYEELLTMAQAQGDSVNQVFYMQQLAYIYDHAAQPENSLKAKQQLAESYLNQKALDKLPALKIAIASDYEALNQPNEAKENYQQAYDQAMSLQQFAYASEALEKLGDLYRSYGQPDTALQVYQALIEVDRQSYNLYGLMNAYDRVAQIYLEQKNYPQALAAFQQGLEVAKSLQYQETYFATQIEQVTQQKSP
ncbi:MAG: tetratricopeptide repeat protein [Aphanothece sp. CMT-3BRIN-NPC111]|nr:tetratricopeptide repeat protein [Aphanothece sp. CMT-3BRIN-NPC111]